jgi:hypothetical protein
MERQAEAAQEVGRAGVLVRATAVREVAARDDQLRLELLHEGGEAGLDPERLGAAHVQVGDVEEAAGHRRWRLYTEFW